MKRRRQFPTQREALRRARTWTRRLSIGLSRGYQAATGQLARLLMIPTARTAMICVAVFVIDAMVPLGVATGALYMAAVLSAAPISYKRAVYATAGICSVLVLVGWVISPGQGQTEWWKVLSNRALAFGVIWAAAGIADSWNRLQQRRFKQLQETRLLHQATTLSASQLSFRAALEHSLKTLCDIFGWPVGHVYLRNVDGSHLLPSGIWRTSGEGNFELLQAAARGLRFAPGEGVPGRVWRDKEPIAVTDVAETRDYAWLKEPGLLGVRGAFALPITVSGNVAAVMEFFSEQPIAVDFEFMPLARNVGEQLGRLFERRRAEQTLRQSEERLRLALEGGGMGIWEWHLETDLVVWSPEVERIHGIEAGTFAGTFEAAVGEIHPDDRQRVLDAIQQAVEQDSDYHAEYRICLGDGRVRWLEGRGALHDDADGQPRRMVGVCMDITERKAAELRNARLAAVVESSDDAILSKALDGTILSWNRGAEKIYGYTAEEIVGKPIGVLVPEDHTDDTRDMMERIGRGERVDHYETLRRRKDGRLITISLSVSPIFDGDGNVVAASSVARDVTERKLAEQEMKEAREKAETANRLRNRFLANMSHELRTPMNSILGMLQLASGERLSPEVRGWLATAKISADSLLLLLNDLLDFSKIEADKLVIKPEPFQLRDMVEGTVRLLAAKAFEKDVELLFEVADDVPDCLLGDAGRVRQILMNLVTNAVKFTEEGEVTVDVDLQDRQPDQAVVRFSVTDTGLGIAPDDRQRIFEPFIQSDATDARRQGGAGLGLSIAAELARRMGGELHLESELGEGSRFWFTLPLRVAAPATPVAAPQQPDPRLHGTRVLVVDACEAGRELLVKMLIAWAMRADAAIDADHALGRLYRAEAEGEPYRLVIADAAMPGFQGATLIRRIADATGETPPVILMHRPCGRAAERPQPAPAVYLEKPISPPRLLEAVARALGGETPASAPLPSTAGRPPRRLSILLAEDTPANQEVATTVLRRRGHDVTVVENGRDAAERVAEQTFDVVLMDVTMPVMDGYQATAAIRRDERQTGRRVAIIAMTAHAAADDRQKCLAAGMDGYLPKPIDVERLVEMVERAAERQVDQTSAPNESTLKQEHRRHTNPSIDYAAALQRLGGDEDLFRKIVSLFDEDAPELLETIRQSVAAGEPVRLQRAAHSLKGLAANFGAADAMAPALRLEEMGKSGDLTGAEEVIGRLAEEIDRLNRDLAPHRKTPAARATVPQP